MMRMIDRFFGKKKYPLVLGYDIDKPRITLLGYALLLLYLGLPAMIIGGAIDGFIQWVTGRCVGLWCWLL